MRLLRLLALMVVLLMPGVAPAQPPSASLPPLGSFTTAQRAEIIAIIREALRTDASLLRDAITALQEEEARAKTSAARGAIGELARSLAGDPVAGNPDGDVTIVEFFDVRCPYCRRMVPVIADLLKRDPGVKLVYKDFPILGPASVLAARALLASQKQGRYVRLHDVLMTGAPVTDMDSLRAAAGRAGVDWDRLQRDMGDPEVQGRIAANLAIGRRLDIQGTPAYVIGERILPGAVDIGELLAAVAAARARK